MTPSVLTLFDEGRRTAFEAGRKRRVLGVRMIHLAKLAPLCCLLRG